MKQLIILITILANNFCFSQELDIFQNDSIYSLNKIKLRTMYLVLDSSLQKEIITHYNVAGQKIKQIRFWNGETNFHNFETFIYSNNGTLSYIIDSSFDGDIEIKTFYYHNNILQKRVSLNRKDTTEFRTYPTKNTTIKCWFRSGKPYRFDTTIFENENAKLEYFGCEFSNLNDKVHRWHYRFKNEFDENRNLTKVYSKERKFYYKYIKYLYDDRNLLIKKQEINLKNNKEHIQMEYIFKYE